ncbi:uncharacterized protein H6S33_007564 [Morchella sextelata]|uniref:uncharacterized protein n=1 Tax=Morchella sextelata TaxID=1174677 RepID=UPI001D0444FD|nr:uncharacterized protein H6S33_007564 [Morchella sextelata]KAH0603905.1 hypothetical protein H6S33_007564 [Morchella sextelata]
MKVYSNFVVYLFPNAHPRIASPITAEVASRVTKKDINNRNKISIRIMSYPRHSLLYFSSQPFQSPSIGPLSYHRYRFTRNYKPAALHDGLKLRSPQCKRGGDAQARRPTTTKTSSISRYQPVALLLPPSLLLFITVLDAILHLADDKTIVGETIGRVSVVLCSDDAGD